MQRQLNIIAISFFCLVAFPSIAQVKVKASVDRTTILVGEPIKFTLQATAPKGATLSWFKTDSIPHFEIIEKGRLDSIEDANGKTYQQQMTITSYDSGYWAIPAFVMRDGKKRVRTDTFAINVTYSPSDPARDYHDIKEIIEVDEPTNYLMWIIGGLGLLLLATAAYFYFRKKKPEAVKKEPLSKLSPFDEAMESLQQVSKLMADDEKVKQYFTGLNDTLRIYLKRKLGIATLEKTNEELILQLRKTRLSDKEFTTIAQSLRMSDFVKFAKYVPQQIDRREALDVVKQTIIRLEDLNKEKLDAV